MDGSSEAGAVGVGGLGWVGCNCHVQALLGVSEGCTTPVNDAQSLIAEEASLQVPYRDEDSEWDPVQELVLDSEWVLDLKWDLGCTCQDAVVEDSRADR